jgi:hypothetical protein
MKMEIESRRTSCYSPSENVQNEEEKEVPLEDLIGCVLEGEQVIVDNYLSTLPPQKSVNIRNQVDQAVNKILNQRGIIPVEMDIIYHNNNN